MSSQTTSATLLGRVQQNDSRAWETLVQLYNDYIRALLLRNHCRVEELDDLTQDVLVTLARKIPDFRPHEHKGAFRGWLKTIVRSKAVDAYRRSKGNPLAEGGTEARIRLQEHSDPIEHAFNGEEDSDPQEHSALKSLYLRAMKLVQAECDPRAWQIFFQVVVENKPAAELARETGISAASIRMAKSRILRRMREIVGEPLDGETSP